MTSAYGRIVTESDIRGAAQATMRTWLRAYCAEVSRQTGRVLVDVRSYAPTVDLPSVAAQRPAGVIAAPGTVGDPERRGDGSYDALWSLGVGVVVAAATRDAAYTLAGDYAAAIRALFVQQPSLGGLAESLRWIGEDVAEVEWTTDRSVHAGMQEFQVVIPNVVNSAAGLLVPLSPDATAPAVAVEVSATHVTLP